jgi:outer membrane protein
MKPSGLALGRRSIGILFAGALALTGTLTLAQTTAAKPITLETAIKSAFERGADVANSTQSFLSARGDLGVKQADPTTLAPGLLQAQQAVALTTSQLVNKRIEVMGNVSSAYLNLYEAQQNLEVLNAQVALDSKNLEIAKAKLAQKNGTELDVRKADSTLSQSKQNVINQKAQLPTLSNKLEVLMGTDLKGDLTVADPPAFKEVKYDLAALEKALPTRVSSVLQAAQGVELQNLNVKLADNDYTPSNTLIDAKANQLTAQRTLDSAQKNALTSLRDAARTVASALETVRLSGVTLQNDTDTLKQDQQRFKNGSLSRVQLQQSELAVLKSSYAQTQARDSYLKTISSLSLTAGTDISGLIEKSGGGS